MKEGRPSVTAGRVALLRAAHQRFDDPPVFVDPLAVRILGATGEDRLWRSKLFVPSEALSGLRAWIVARSRFAEDELARARDRGVEQYVVLGAGLDTFGYRPPHDPRPLEVFEVDHPATQAWKRRRLAESSIPVPRTLHFVPTDFEGDHLLADLAAAGFRSGAPAFFAWLGVTMYLTRPAIDATLDALAAMAPKSGVVLDYFDRSARARTAQRVARRVLSVGVAHLGEPFLSAFDSGEIPAALRVRGFREIRDLGATEVNDRYFSGRADRLRVVSPVGRVLAAELPAR